MGRSALRAHAEAEDSKVTAVAAAAAIGNKLEIAAEVSYAPLRCDGPRNCTTGNANELIPKVVVSRKL